jgi:hypothetical protein
MFNEPDASPKLSTRTTGGRIQKPSCQPSREVNRPHLVRPVRELLLTRFRSAQTQRRRVGVRYAALPSSLSDLRGKMFISERETFGAKS